jgi:hypothetical protein
MSTPLFGRNARLYKDGVVIAYGKNISVKGAATETIREYTMDSLEPALIAAGKQAFTWTIEKLYTNGEWMSMLLDGTEFSLVFQPAGAYLDAPYEEWNNCVVLNVERKAGEAGGLLEFITGETRAVVVNDS